MVSLIRLKDQKVRELQPQRQVLWQPRQPQVKIPLLPHRQLQ